MITTPDPRDLIQRLADALDNASILLTGAPAQSGSVADEARAYLASTPEPAAEPTDEEILMLSGEHFDYKGDCDSNGFVPVSIGPSINLSHEVVGFARAVLARWGHQPPQPISVDERLPGPEDLDAEGRCWIVRLQAPRDVADECAWLPHHALPLPEVP